MQYADIEKGRTIMAPPFPGVDRNPFRNFSLAISEGTKFSLIRQETLKVDPSGGQYF